MVGPVVILPPEGGGRAGGGTQEKEEKKKEWALETPLNHYIVQTQIRFIDYYLDRIRIRCINPLYWYTARRSH
jgi:hypothetical protein